MWWAIEEREKISAKKEKEKEKKIILKKGEKSGRKSW